jgi:glycosyltransferase involved in cell wall biosynthesis
MDREITTSGFTIVRNAEILDFPFRESVLSALPLCDEFIINCGDSDDHTLSICEELRAQFPEKIKIIRSVWTRENQTGGYQLKAQSDAAMKECQGKWLVYIQADEVFHEEDLSKVRTAMALANSIEQVDGLVFDYLHFYGNYFNISKGRNWYRREVRVFKNGRGIESFRDAQGFRKQGERLTALASGARVFHYGYVRSQKSLKTKVEQMSQWWGETPSKKDSSFQVFKLFGLTRFESSHPQVMRERVAKNPDYIDPSCCKRKWSRKELKNALTLVWEKIFPYRIGEYRNYDLFSPKP